MSREVGTIRSGSQVLLTAVMCRRFRRRQFRRRRDLGDTVGERVVKGGGMMRISAILLIGLAVASSSNATAKSRFVAYEGKDSISEGRGGTKVVSHGIDFWTTGEPPRRFQVLGLLTDNRSRGWFNGDAVGSGLVAAKIKEAGGDAAILLGQSSQITGYVHGGQATMNGGTAYGYGWSRPVSEETTRMVVIKYLAP